MRFTERQIEIIHAATELIGQKGIQNLTTKNLASKMNFSEPAIYRHFNNKTEILQSILLFYKDQMKDKMKELIDSDYSGLEILQKMIKNQFSHFSKFPAISTVVFSETSFQNEEVLSKTVQQIVGNKKKLICQLIERGQQDGSIRTDVNAKDIAPFYIGAIRFTVLEWSLNNHKENLEKKAVMLNETLNQLF